jgi:Homing endonuclease associated repeat/HNH endonuclease
MPRTSVRYTASRLLNYSESEIVKEIRRVILDECSGKIPNQTRFLEIAKISHWIIKTKFGTYAQALQKAGFIYVDAREAFTPELILNTLHEVLRRTNGYCFSHRMYRQHGGSYSFNTIKAILNAGSWEDVMGKIEAKPRPHIQRVTLHSQRLKQLAKLTHTDLLNEIDRIWQSLGRRPTYGEFRHSSQFGMSIYESQFGSWLKAMQAFCTNNDVRVQGRTGTQVTKGMLCDELKAVKGKHSGDLLTYDFYKANGGTYSIGTFQAHFESWTNAVNAVDGISGRQSKYSKDELFDEMQRLWEELGKQPSWREMFMTGKISPKPYKSVFGTWSQAVHAFCEDRNALEFAETVVSVTKPSANVVKDTPKMQQPTIGIFDLYSAPLIELRMTGRYVSPRLRFRVFHRDDFTCQACGRSRKEHGVILEVDHIKAYANGGETIFENLQALCSVCNSGKSNLF